MKQIEIKWRQEPFPSKRSMTSIHHHELDAWRVGRRYNYGRRKELMASHDWSEAIDLKKRGSCHRGELGGRLLVTANIKERSIKEVLSPLDASTG